MEQNQEPELRVCLVGCGKAKRPEPASAREVYTGSLFRAARDYAEERADYWWIVSAAGGLIHPESRLRPYEKRLSTAFDRRDRWGHEIVAMLCKRLGVTTTVQLERYGAREVAVYGEQTFGVTLLMGADYARPIAWHLARLGIAFECPLEGLGLGARLHWFAEQARVSA